MIDEVDLHTKNTNIHPFLIVVMSTVLVCIVAALFSVWYYIQEKQSAELSSLTSDNILDKAEEDTTLRVDGIYLSVLQAENATNADGSTGFVKNYYRVSADGSVTELISEDDERMSYFSDNKTDYLLDVDNEILSPDKSRVVYVESATEKKGKEEYSLDAKTVVIIDVVTGEKREIENANNPQWIKNGQYLMYLKEDGVYIDSLDVENSEPYLLYSDEGVMYSDKHDFLATEDLSYLVVTGPNASGYNISVFKDMDETESASLQLILDETTTYKEYFNPILDPTGQNFVVWSRFADINDKYQYELQIRSLGEDSMYMEVPLLLSGEITEVFLYSWL